MIDTKLKGLKRADLEAELELYREAGTEGVATNEDLTNVKACVAEIERLQKEVGMPVKLTAEFMAENKVLSDYLVEQGAKEGEIVFAEEADMEEVEKIKAEIAKKEGEGAGSNVTGAAPTAPKVEKEYVFNGKTVIRVENALVHGKSVKDVYVASGEVFRMSPAEFEKDVTVRK